MAPKSWPPRRNSKTTARKSVHSKCTSTLRPFLPASSDDSLYDPRPPSTATATSSPGLPLNDAKGYMNRKLEKSSTLQSSPSNLDAEPQEEILVMSSGKKIAVEGKVQESNRANSVPSVAGISSCSKADEEGAVVGSCQDEMNGNAGTEGEGKGGNEASEVDKEAAVGADEAREEGESRTRKVVKKKVRIVKRIVKRRVPKRVVKDGVVNEEVGTVDNVSNWSERNEGPECEKLEPLATASMDTENSKLDENVALQVENESLKEMKLQPMKIIKTSPTIEKEIEPVDNVGNLSKNELGISEIEKTDLSGTLSVQTETYEADASVASEVKSEDLKGVKAEAIDCIKTGPSFQSGVKGEDEEELCVSIGKHASEALVAGQNAGKESQGIQDEFENQDVQFLKMESGELVEDRNTAFIKERQGEGEEVVMELDENNDVGLNGGLASGLETEALGGEGEVVKEVVEKNDIGVNGGVPLSEEMEALERKKRRRTEVFLGGLDKDTKEEDIRKVFEQVGEITEVRLVMNGNTGKNKGFAFLRFASAADAKKALEKYSAIKICGKQCGVRAVEGNDTIFLGNINKKWKTEDVVKLLKDARIEKIDKVTVMTNPSNFEQNRGFAFLEFETSKDAQVALSKLQKHDVFINQMKMKVAWAQPLNEPKEEEMLKVKSIYAEYLPSSWDEEKVMGCFKRFGEIESISLARNLPSSKRKDFAFVNYAMREAALACVQAFSHGQVDDAGSELRVKVSLAKPNPKGMQKKHVSGTTGKELNEKRKASESIIKVHERRKKGKPATSNLEGTRVNRTASATDELLQLLRQQALVGQKQPGSSNLNYQYSLPGGKGPLSALGSRPLPSDPRVFPRTYMETSHLSRSPSAVSHSVGLVSLPYSQRPRTSHILGTSYGFEDNPHVKMRQQPNYFEQSGIYRRY